MDWLLVSLIENIPLEAVLKDNGPIIGQQLNLDRNHVLLDLSRYVHSREVQQNERVFAQQRLV
jgi:hypothetical protein